MESLLRYVGTRNIDLFVRRLETEEDPRSRDGVRRLLIEEEDKFARGVAFIELLERHIQAAADRIAEQQQRLESLERCGGDTTEARRLLANFVDIHRLFVASWAATLDGIDQRGP